MTTEKRNPEKKTDLPPKGACNPDPLTGAAGAHPIEAGVGAAAAGAGIGVAAGMAAGPIGAAVGAAAGGIIGGLVGKAVGEQIDPTTDDCWLRDNFTTRPYVKKGEKFENYQSAYRYGGAAECKFRGKNFDHIENDLRSDWDKTHAKSGMAWDRAREAVKDAYNRTVQLREEHLKVQKTPVETGNVNVRKEVVTEQKRIDVPVEREEVVIERRPVSGQAACGDIKAEEIRIPVKEEKVHVTKEAVVKEEVSVGKRKVTDTQHVSGTVRKEELKVDQKGDARVCETHKEKR